MLICYCFLVSKTCTGWWSCDICSWKIKEDIARVPFTGHQFYIHSPCNCHCTFILGVPLGDQQFLLAFSTIFPYLQFYRHGGDHDGDWIFFDYAIEWKLCTWIEHAAVFKDKVYCNWRCKNWDIESARFSTLCKNAGSTWRRSSPYSWIHWI